ncbi:MAG: penicillin-binding protein activator [Candidatus Schmidhempelia sp.]|nr:penicillin-binding protein activator [Candidatus Schmidhempelia sp.]
MVGKQVIVSLNYWVKVLITILLISLSVGCHLDQTSSTATTAGQTVVYNPNNNSTYYRQLSQNAKGSTKVDLQLMLIRALLAENRLAEAENELATLNTNLNQAQLIEKQLSGAELAIRQQQRFNLASVDMNVLSIEQKYRYYQIKLLQEQQNNDINAQARDYIVLETLATPSLRQYVINQTWQFFNSLSDNDLQNIVVYANEINLQGWIQLVYAYRQSLIVEPITQINSEGETETVVPELTDQERHRRISKAISSWQIQYPSHPAVMYVKNAIFGIKQDTTTYDTSNASNVALLLPLTGASKIFGEAIRAGYMDATNFYPDEKRQNIQVFDTTADSLQSILYQAKQQGAQLIVGPLLKNDVVNLTRLNPQLPVLALNKIHDQHLTMSPSNNNVCYFALSPEEEASDAAKHIMKQNKHVPLIITTDNNIGRRVAKAFASSWYTTATGPVYVQYFTSAAQLKQKMNTGIGLKVEGQLLKTNLINSVDDTFMPNSNIDAIYIFATQEELDFIKPMLEMKTTESKLKDNSESNVDVPPLYTSSRSHSANTTVDYRLEMEGMQFSDIPLLMNHDTIYSQLPSNIQQDYSLARLYAMGMDAWRLANHFDKLLTQQNPVLDDGLTGKIVVNSDCEIQRQLVWSVYQRGEIQLIDQPNDN